MFLVTIIAQVVLLNRGTICVLRSSLVSIRMELPNKVPQLGASMIGVGESPIIVVHLLIVFGRVLSEVFSAGSSLKSTVNMRALGVYQCAGRVVIGIPDNTRRKIRLRVYEPLWEESVVNFAGLQTCKSVNYDS